jgi:AraC family transcriptional regulator of adaptative response/methylated-DNA-[protein]-cysteine methyltransferase
MQQHGQSRSGKVARAPPRTVGVVPAADLTTPTGRVAAAAAAMTAAGGPVPLADLACRAACSPRQLQRDFAVVLGVTPRQFGASVRAAGARRSLHRTSSVGNAMYDAGYGSVRAFYTEAAARLGMAPREYAARAAGRTLLWSMADTPIGDLLAVASPDGLCAARIGEAAALEAEIRGEFAAATLVRDDGAMADVMAALQALAQGLPSPELPVCALGTAFQARVWDALRQIPSGQTRTYTQVARAIGSPGSARAVARACATNPVALAVPCHRVIRTDGDLAGYRWGLVVKQSLLAAEQRVAVAVP